jgi:hypothetical protein
MKKLDVRKFLNEILLENEVGEDVKEIYCVWLENSSGSGMNIMSEEWRSREEWLDFELSYFFGKDEEENEEIECGEEYGNKMVSGFSYEKFDKVDEWGYDEDFYSYSKYVKKNNLKGVIKSNDGEYCEVWYYIK